MKNLNQTLSMLLLSALMVGCGFAIVDTGHRGVKTRFGEVVSGPLAEGFYIYNPFTSTIVEMDTRVQKWSKETLCYTADIQNVKVNYSLNYRPDSANMANFYKEVGMDWDLKLLPQIVEGKVKEVIGRYDAVKLISDREKANKEMYDLIKSEMELSKIILVNFEITNLNYNDAFEKAVEAKVVAIQTAEEAKNKTVRVQEEANQQIIAAKAEAESMRIRAQALSQNKSLVEYEAVQKWNGKFPEYMMGNSVPFVSLQTNK